MATTSTGEAHAYLWSGGVMQDLGTLGGSSGADTAINDLGQVVGNSRTAGGELHSFLWQGGAMTDLGALGGVGFSGVCWELGKMRYLGPGEARNVSEEGQAVGSSGPHAALWKSRVLRDLGALDASSTSAATSAANVGESTQIDGDQYSRDGRVSRGPVDRRHLRFALRRRRGHRVASGHISPRPATLRCPRWDSNPH
jgi:probable HAF family extracellular repeat protein